MATPPGCNPPAVAAVKAATCYRQPIDPAIVGGEHLCPEDHAIPDDPLASLLTAIRACTACAAHLPLGPRPIVQAAPGAAILIIGQAPGTAVHASGVPWDDPSGDRLREWTGLSRTQFYDPQRVALMPMGFCYPGKIPAKGSGAGGDAPPRAECAPLWHAPLMAQLGAVRLTLLVGQYAQAAYAQGPKSTLTERVRAFESAPPDHMALPHPSWRSTGWMRRNPWFEAEVLPLLRARVGGALAGLAPPAV